MDIAGIRQSFVRYYEDMGYRLLPSAPMIDPSIPMSFVMSAGLVQVENSIARSAYREGNQFVLVQNCFRHFDVEKVGTDDIHLSLFQMPGAFVFGPDGKNGTIQRMLALATQILGIGKDRIWVSYFKGGKVLGEYIPEDQVTRQDWLDTGIPENRIVGLGPDNNYWIQGRGIEDTSITRKCGPNTELFYDRGEEKSCGEDCLPGCKCGRFIEFSNSLFISSEITHNDGHIQPLEHPFTETVIGAERVNMIQQEARSVFELIEFTLILESLQSLTKNNDLPEGLRISCERAIADHMRGLFYLVAGGAPPPGKNGRERIVKILIRRILTRLIALNVDIWGSIPVLIASTSNSIHDVDHKEEISRELLGYFSLEYHRFMKTIQRGQHQLANYIKENGGGMLSEQQIVFLEKKWGFPSLLTELILMRQRVIYQDTGYKSLLHSVH